MSQGHGPHGTRSVGLELHLPLWDSAAFFFQKKKQKGKGMILYHPSFETRPSHASTIMRRRAWRGQRVNELQQQQHEKRVRMYACTEPVGTGIGAVCVERGGPTCTKTMLNGAQKHTF